MASASSIAYVTRYWLGCEIRTLGMDNNKPVVVVRPSSYQPGKAELEEDVRVDATPESASFLLPVRMACSAIDPWCA